MLAIPSERKKIRKIPNTHTRTHEQLKLHFKCNKKLDDFLFAMRKKQEKNLSNNDGLIHWYVVWF